MILLPKEGINGLENMMSVQFQQKKINTCFCLERITKWHIKFESPQIF